MKKLAVFLLVFAILTTGMRAAPDDAEPANTEKSADAPTPVASPESKAKAESEPPAVEPAKGPSVRKKKAAAPVVEEPEPAPTSVKKPSMLKRMFGRKPKPTPQPTPTPKPKAKSTPAPKATPAAKPDAEAAPEPDAKATPAPKPLPKSRGKQKATPEPKKNEVPENANPPSEPIPVPQPPGDEPPAPKLDPALTPAVEEKTSAKPDVSPVELDSKERTKFNAVRAKALQDKSVAGLKAKAEGAGNDAELRKASKDFYKALYKKMRALDGSLKERIDLMEAAMNRRLDANMGSTIPEPAEAPEKTPADQ